jgi:cell division protein FtsB
VGKWYTLLVNMLTKIKKILPKLKILQDVRVLGLIAFGIVALLVTWSGVKVAQTNYELAKKISVARQRNDIARLENDNLRLKNKYYETNQFLELAARRQFGRAQPGEKLYIVPEQSALKRTIDMPLQTSKIPKEPVKKSRFQQNIDKWIDFLSQ